MRHSSMGINLKGMSWLGKASTVITLELLGMVKSVPGRQISACLSESNPEAAGSKKST